MGAEIHYAAPPGLAGLYRKLILGKRKGLKPGESLPDISAHWDTARADATRLAGYRETCGLADDGCLPITYPHVLTGRLHLGILAHDQFPLSPMGALHMRNHILQHTPIPADATLRVYCRIGGSRVVKAGLEFDITTVVETDGARPWESISTYLVRGRKFGEPVEPPAIAEMPVVEQANVEKGWHVPKNMGRRYAKISGDYNPIHVSRVLAKLFGFKRDIIHGMWMLAKTLGELPPLPEGGKQRCDVSFKGPVFMDHDTSLKAQAGETAHAFEIYCQGNDRPSITGGLRVAEDSESLVD